MYCVLCTVYCVLCTVYCVLSTVYCVLCTMYCVLCTVYYALCTVLQLLASKQYYSVPIHCTMWCNVYDALSLCTALQCIALSAICWAALQCIASTEMQYGSYSVHGGQSWGAQRGPWCPHGLDGWVGRSLLDNALHPLTWSHHRITSQGAGGNAKLGAFWAQSMPLPA